MHTPKPLRHSTGGIAKLNFPLVAFVSGGTGFLGGHLIAELLRQGYTVHGLARSESAAETLRQRGAQPLLLSHFLSTPLETPIAEARAFYHLAGLTKTIRPAEFEAVNGSLSAELARAAQAGGFRGRWLQVSSLAAAGPAPENRLRAVADRLTPVSLYGKSKLHGERLVRQVIQNADLTIVRPGAIYGPGDRDFLEVLKTLRFGVSLAVGAPFHVQLTHALDVARGCIAAAESPKTAGKTYFLNHPDVWLYDDAMALFAELLGKSNVRTIRLPKGVGKAAAATLDLLSRIARKPLSPFTVDKWREATAGNWIADSAPLSEDSGWEATISLRQGMRETIEVYREQKLL